MDLRVQLSDRKLVKRVRPRISPLISQGKMASQGVIKGLLEWCGHEAQS